MKTKFKIFGFSLVELLIGIGIMSILAGIGIPNYIGFRQKVIIDSDTQKVVGVLQNAISNAESQKDSSIWSFNINVAENYVEILQDGTITSDRVYLDSQVSFADISTDGATTLFGGPSINVSDSTINIALTAQNDRYVNAITMDTFGIIDKVSIDYKNIGQLRSEMVRIRNEIKELEKLLDKTQNEEDRIALQGQIDILEQSLQKIYDLIEASENEFSLLGWIKELFE